MAKDENGKRKATEDPASPVASKRLKHSEFLLSDDEKKPEIKPIPFPEKPAVLEERNGEIEFRVVNNDNNKDSLIILTGLKCIFQKQLPKMPKDYIARLVYDRTHLSIAIVKKPLEVVGGITYRPFKGRRFAEIVFCAISSDQQVKGYGAHLMSHLKDYVKATSDVMHFLTYADNYAIGYFHKQGFTKEITLDRSVWMGYIKDYEGGTIMQCSMLPRVRYLNVGRMLLKQKECVLSKIRAYSKSDVIHQPPKQWKSGVSLIDPMSIEAIKASGWSPDMDELARQPRHGPNYNSLLHLLNDMQNHQSAWPFLVPVNKDEVADYYDVIKEPMDLSTMEQKLEADQYPTPEDFVKDARLVFDNCRRYNNETTPYAKCANKLENDWVRPARAGEDVAYLERHERACGEDAYMVKMLGPRRRQNLRRRGRPALAPGVTAAGTGQQQQAHQQPQQQQPAQPQQSQSLKPGPDGTCNLQSSSTTPPRTTAGALQNASSPSPSTPGVPANVSRRRPAAPAASRTSGLRNVQNNGPAASVATPSQSSPATTAPEEPRSLRRKRGHEASPVPSNKSQKH
ncbi:Bromodomain-containing protein [Zalerion maritima]|uniref:histone acetyltransferase n=1 Tax=Zalerion maritima TaxID=339359 RepID=A0AAD5WUF0_9PEZI|nr:Bromodomain-containing protein [Zalerion maritima]